MEYKVFKNEIKILGKEDFNPQHILECGQIFSYEKREEDGKTFWDVFSADKMARIFESDDGYVVKTKFPEYFVNFFDLKTDYEKIKSRLSKFPILKEPIKFGYGIRILKQDLFEVVISFIVSANNNIKRIKLILNRFKEKFGTRIDNFYAFPTREQLLKATVQDFSQLGAGYRDKYLHKVLRQIDEDILQSWQVLPTNQLRAKLLELAGVGPKVADCILLFGFGRGDVFPVDTWIEKMYNKFYKPENNRQIIRKELTEEFKFLSGYAQQYLFYYMIAKA